MPLVKVENLTFSYDGCVTPVFDNVSFSFDTNWKTGSIGRNGIGKSTLFKLLLSKDHTGGTSAGIQDSQRFWLMWRMLLKQG